MLILIIYLVLIIPSYVIVRKILRGDDEEYDWYAVGAAFIISILWPFAVVVIIIGVLTGIAKSIVKSISNYFKNSQPPKWL